jgi:tetratricopeptide (TPR) repeat protein
MTIVFLPTFAQAEDHLDIQRLSNQGQAEEVLEQALARLETSPDDILLHHLVGVSLVQLGRGEEARPYFEFCIESGVKDWRYAWSLLYLGGIDIEAGAYEAAREKWLEVRDGRITENVARNAANNLRGFGLDEAFDDWIRQESGHLRVQFSPMHADKDIDRWMKGHEMAWERLTELIGGAPDVPVRYIVWGDLAEARELCGITSLGFARPEYALIHCRWEQTVGHELAHVFVGRVLQPTVTTRFVNEGLAVAHDLTNRNRLDVARGAMGETGVDSVDLELLWTGQHPGGEDILYPVSGAWIDFLIREAGREKVLELARNQTIESAAAIYGEDFAGLVVAFEDLLND